MTLAAFARAGAVAALFLSLGFLATWPVKSVVASVPPAEQGPAPGTVLAQTEPPPGSDLEKEEEDWEEDPADTLALPPGFTPPPPAGTTPSPSPGTTLQPTTAATDSTGAATASDSTGAGAVADSTAGATLLPAVPAQPATGDTLRYVPGASPPPAAAKPAGAQAAAAPPPRKGIFGLHPAAIAFGLILAHYFVVKSATD